MLPPQSDGPQEVCFHDIDRRSNEGPTPTTLRITDDREANVEAPMVKIRAFQLTAEEARSVPYVVTGMFLFILLLLSLNILMFYLFVNRDVFSQWCTHVLFDSGVT